MLMLVFVLMLLSIYFSNFIKFLFISELFLMCIFFIMMMSINMNIFNSFLVLFSIMILESCLGMILMFEFFKYNKNFLLNNMVNF